MSTNSKAKTVSVLYQNIFIFTCNHCNKFSHCLQPEIYLNPEKVKEDEHLIEFYEKEELGEKYDYTTIKYEEDIKPMLPLDKMKDIIKYTSYYSEKEEFIKNINKNNVYLNCCHCNNKNENNNFDIGIKFICPCCMTENIQIQEQEFNEHTEILERVIKRTIDCFNCDTICLVDRVLINDSLFFEVNKLLCFIEQ